MAALSEIKNEEVDLSTDIKEWDKHKVKQWALQEAGVEEAFADILFEQDINGSSLLLLDKTELKDLGITFGPAKLIIHARDELLKIRKDQPRNLEIQAGHSCQPYPFHRYHDGCRYIEHGILDITESGATDYIEPCHEYKAFIHAPDEHKMKKFIGEVMRFAAACMNSRTNGTIHFGVGDMPEFTHGQVLGVVVEDKEVYVNALNQAIDGHFEYKHIQAAKICIKPPRFVGVLNQDMTSSKKCVIEVDIVPSSTVCKEDIYHIFSLDIRKAKKKSKCKEEEMQVKYFFVRDGGSSRDLLAQTTFAKPMAEYNKFVDNMTELSQLRKQAEEKHLSVVKSSTQGSRLSEMITGGSHSLDKSHFERYVVITNKSHSIQLESLSFLLELNPTAVLDFDPESAKNGLQCHLEQQSTLNTHLPAEYKITEAVEDIANKLKLTKNTSWVFCNGGIKDEPHSHIMDWLIEKGASVRDVISFLCRKDVLPQKRYLVIFLLLSTVNEKIDPLVEAFGIFLQELKGTEQILCICENERAFTCWKDLIYARFSVSISGRCIYELSFAQVNGTILSLLSENRKSSRFLPCGGGSRVLLERKGEGILNALDVLCVNQCEGGNDEKVLIEEKFYKGGKVAWWNFYFSDQPDSTPFIKRDKFDYIVDTVIADLCSLRKACVLFSLEHLPGCGGTTLAKHVLWSLKHKFRCAVLKDCNADLTEAALQAVKLLMYGNKEETPPIPVLLMIDDFEDMDKVFDLQHLIEQECVKRNIQARSPQVILLNCIRSEHSQQSVFTEATVFIGNTLSDKEQKLFEHKLVEIEKTHKNFETFYGFMIMKKNFSKEYVQGVARNTLKSFSLQDKHAQLFAVLVLLNVYCCNASLSVSLCEEFLGLKPKPVCGSGRIEDGLEKFSTLVTTILVEGKVAYEAVKIIHSSIAWHCLEELKTTCNVTAGEITYLLLNTDDFYNCMLGRDKLMKDVHYMLVKRHFSVEEESQFSPLIHDIAREASGMTVTVETVLLIASKRYEKDAIISQLLARYFYLKRKDFKQAKDWAGRAKDLSRESSYITDTSAQVIKHELKNAIGKEKDFSIKPDKLNTFLKMAQSATDIFRETHCLAKKECMHRIQNRSDNCTFNTSGCLGEIQVAVFIIDILEKTPMFFSQDPVGHDLMSRVLSGNIKIQDIEKNDPWHSKHSTYYAILKQFEGFLYSLRIRMKTQIDLLENFYVNLGSRFGMKDNREQVAQMELFRCFKKYANLFCRTDSTELLKNKHLNTKLKVEHNRQFLENRKVDTHSGILNCLYRSDVKSSQMEEIAKRYDFVLKTADDVSLKDSINFIYVNVVLSCIKPECRLLQPYQKLVDLLCKVLHGPITFNDNLALYFIAVALLWPQGPLRPDQTKNLKLFVSQMRVAYHTVMKEVYNGKRPTIHFLMGKKQGYERLIPLKDIEKCVTDQPQQVALLGENGKIWKERKVQELLYRATGEVQGKFIQAETYHPNVKVDLSPVFRSQLSGRPDGSKVSFFVGFSMNGPLAIDIE